MISPVVRFSMFKAAMSPMRLIPYLFYMGSTSNAPSELKKPAGSCRFRYWLYDDVPTIITGRD
jgi:hypothetical protein